VKLVLTGFRSRWIAKSNGAVAVDLAIHSEPVYQNLFHKAVNQAIIGLTQFRERAASPFQAGKLPALRGHLIDSLRKS
jgi:hypothetical protein